MTLRYEFTTTENRAEIIPHPDGSFVLHEDYLTLERKVEHLTEVLELALSSGEVPNARIDELWIADECVYCGYLFGESGETANGFNAECIRCGKTEYERFVTTLKEFEARQKDEEALFADGEQKRALEEEMRVDGAEP